MEIKLTQGHITIIDDEDYAIIAGYKWNAYIRSNKLLWATATIRIRGKNASVRMHRLITKATKDQDVDHINGNGLDNRKINLRFCTKSQNNFNRGPKASNTSGYKGVSFKNQYKKWVAQIQINGKKKHIGYFNDPKEAAKAYNIKALELFGEFARINIID